MKRKKKKMFHSYVAYNRLLAMSWHGRRQTGVEFNRYKSSDAGKLKIVLIYNRKIHYNHPWFFVCRVFSSSRQSTIRVNGNIAKYGDTCIVIRDSIHFPGERFLCECGGGLFVLENIKLIMNALICYNPTLCSF